MRSTPEDGNECHWAYSKNAKGTVCKGACDKCDPSGGVIEVFLGCIGGSWYESFDYTILHLLVHHLQAGARDLTLTTLTPRVPTEAEAGVNSPQEIEAAYLSRLFLSLSRLSTVTIREAMSYSQIWRPLMSIRFGAIRPLGKDEKIDQEAIELLENPFGIVRALSFKLRKLQTIAEVTRRGAGFRAYVRNVLGIEVWTDFDSIEIRYDQLVFTLDAGRLSACYGGDHPRIPGTSFSVVSLSPSH